MFLVGRKIVTLGNISKWSDFYLPWVGIDMKYDFSVPRIGIKNINKRDNIPSLGLVYIECKILFSLGLVLIKDKVFFIS